MYQRKARKAKTAASGFVKRVMGYQDLMSPKEIGKPPIKKKKNDGNKGRSESKSRSSTPSRSPARSPAQSSPGRSSKSREKSVSPGRCQLLKTNDVQHQEVKKAKRGRPPKKKAIDDIHISTIKTEPLRCGIQRNQVTGEFHVKSATMSEPKKTKKKIGLTKHASYSGQSLNGNTSPFNDSQESGYETITGSQESNNSVLEAVDVTDLFADLGGEEDHSKNDFEVTDPSGILYPSNRKENQSGFLNQFCLIKKSELKVIDPNDSRLNRECGGRLRRTIKPKMAPEMVYRKLTLARGTIIKGLTEDSGVNYDEFPRVSSKNKIFEKEHVKQLQLSPKCSSTLKEQCSKIPVIKLEKSPSGSGEEFQAIGSPAQKRLDFGEIEKMRSVSPRLKKKKEWLKPPVRKRTLSEDKNEQLYKRQDTKKDKSLCCKVEKDVTKQSKNCHKSIKSSNKGSHSKKTESKIRLIGNVPFVRKPPPPKKSETEQNDAAPSRRSVRQRGREKKEWWHLLRAAPDEYEDDPKWEADEQERQERIDKRQAKMDERDRQNNEDIEDEEESEEEEVDEIENTSKSKMLYRKGNTLKKSSKSQQKSKDGDVAETIKREIEEMNSEEEQEGDVVRYKSRNKVLSLKWNLSRDKKTADKVFRSPKKVNAKKKKKSHTTEKGSDTCTKMLSKDPQILRKSKSKNKEKDSQCVEIGVVTNGFHMEFLNEDHKPFVPEVNECFIQHFKSTIRECFDNPDRILPGGVIEMRGKELQSVLSLRTMSKKKTSEEHVAGSETSSDVTRSSTPSDDLSEPMWISTELPYKHKEYECATPHMCNICWVNDHMYCKNMKRTARDLPPCGGCIHYIPCDHYRHLKDPRNYSHCVKSFNSDLYRERYETYTSKDVTNVNLQTTLTQDSQIPTSNTELLTSVNDDDIRRETTSPVPGSGSSGKHEIKTELGIKPSSLEDLMCTEQMEESEPNSPEFPDGTEMLKVQIRARAVQIAKSLGFDTPIQGTATQSSMEELETLQSQQTMEYCEIEEHGAEEIVGGEDEENHYDVPLTIAECSAIFEEEKIDAPPALVQKSETIANILGKKAKNIKKLRIRVMPAYLKDTKSKDIEEFEDSPKLVQVDSQKVNSEHFSRMAETALDEEFLHTQADDGEMSHTAKDKGADSFMVSLHDNPNNPTLNFTIKKSSKKKKKKSLGQKNSDGHEKEEEEEEEEEEGLSESEEKETVTTKPITINSMKAELPASLQKQSKSTEDGSQVLTFTTKEIREKKPALLAYIKKAGLTPILCEKLRMEKEVIQRLVRHTDSHFNRTAEELEQKKCLLAAVVSEIEMLKDKIKGIQGEALELEAEHLKLNRKRTTLLDFQTRMAKRVKMFTKIINISKQSCKTPNSKTKTNSGRLSQVSTLAPPEFVKVLPNKIVSHSGDKTNNKTLPIPMKGDGIKGTVVKLPQGTCRLGAFTAKIPMGVLKQSQPALPSEQKVPSQLIQLPIPDQTQVVTEGSFQLQEIEPISVQMQQVMQTNTQSYQIQPQDIVADSNLLQQVPLTVKQPFVAANLQTLSDQISEANTSNASHNINKQPITLFPVPPKLIDRPISPVILVPPKGTVVPTALNVMVTKSKRTLPVKLAPKKLQPIAPVRSTNIEDQHSCNSQNLKCEPTLVKGKISKPKKSKKNKTLDQKVKAPPKNKHKQKSQNTIRIEPSSVSSSMCTNIITQSETMEPLASNSTESSVNTQVVLSNEGEQVQVPVVFNKEGELQLVIRLPSPVGSPITTGPPHPAAPPVLHLSGKDFSMIQKALSPIAGPSKRPIAIRPKVKEASESTDATLEKMSK